MATSNAQGSCSVEPRPSKRFSGEWETRRLGDLLTFVTTANNPHSDLGDNGDVHYIHYGDVHAHSQPVLDCVQSNLPRIDRTLVERIAPVQDGDLVIVDASEDLEGVGKSIEILGVQGKTVVAGLHTILCRGNSEFWATGFKAYLQFMPAFKGALTRVATGISVYAISKSQLAEITLPLPEQSEQCAIAAVLSDIDSLIDAIDALIAKKQAVKKATMQRLLTGQTRLPGFSGEWKTKRLGELGTFAKGYGIRRSDLSDNGLPCVLYGELYTRYGESIVNPVSKVPQEVAQTALPIEAGELLFAGSGETIEDIGRCAAYLGTSTAYAGGDIIVLTPTEGNSLYLGHLMNHPGVSAQKARMGHGATIAHINTRNLAQIQIDIPEDSEQCAIAEILTDMDAEFEALERRRDKTEAIKQGMMQELLTGKTRLPEAKE